MKKYIFHFFLFISIFISQGFSMLHYYYDEINQAYQKCDASCLTCNGPPVEDDTNCIECNTEAGYISSLSDQSNCIKQCNFNESYFYIKEINSILYYYCTETLECPEDFPLLIKSKNQCVNKCDDNNHYLYNNNCIPECSNNMLIDKINKKCFDYPENLNNITSDINKIILGLPTNKELYFNNNQLLIMVFNSSDKSDNLVINLEECINLLSSVYYQNDLNEFLLVKIKIFKNFNEYKIDYLLFSEFGELLNLTLCNELNIKIEYFISNVTDENLQLAQKLKEENNIDLFDKNDDFFHDLCINFTSKNGTDVILKDRMRDYYINVSLCEKNCSYLMVNYENKTMVCACPIKSNVLERIDYEDEEYDENDINDEITSSNYEVIICYNVVFTRKVFFINLGNYIFLFLGIVHYLLVFYYLLNGKKNIISNIIKNKKNNRNKNSNPPVKRKINNIINFKLKKIPENISIEEYSFDENEHNNENISIKKNNEFNSSYNDIQLKSINISRKSESINNSSFNKISLLNKNKLILKDINKNYNHINKNKIYNQDFINLKRKKKSRNFNKYSNTITNNNMTTETTLLTNGNNIKSKKTTTDYIISPFIKDDKKNKKKIKNIKNINIDYDDISFEISILIDQRSFWGMFWQYLKERHIFLCMIFNCEKILKYIRVSIFIISTSTDFFFNSLFYSDKYISKIYENELYGIKEFWVTLPKNILSVILAQIYISFLEFLINSRNIEIFIKNFKFKQKYLRQINYLISNYQIKLNIYIIISNISMIFFWYYVCAFCGVYQNSQFNWVKDIFMSFIIGLIYPLILCLIATSMRIIGLKKRIKILFYLSKLFLFFV